MGGKVRVVVFDALEVARYDGFVESRHDACHHQHEAQLPEWR